MKKITFLFFAAGIQTAFGQKIQTPDQIYGQLFVDVQMNRIFPDNKTFVDCVPKRDPKAIVADYKKAKNNPSLRFSLSLFVEQNFEIPKQPQLNYITKEKDVQQHIKNLWSVLRREKDKAIKGSSLLPLPYPYIVPGGRFREIYYWDSYFTMQGLKESGENEMIENMVRNFAYLINTYGHIPNGNRSYYLSRSQPPYFSSMVELLAEIKGSDIYRTFLSSLEKEYQYWMKGSSTLKTGSSFKRVVKLSGGAILNRYWDDNAIPRQESYKEDVETADQAVKNLLMVALFKDAAQQKKATDALQLKIYRNLRASAESGMDFSSRWFEDGEHLTTIQTTDIIPVDLNCLLFHLEKTLEKAYKETNNIKRADYYRVVAERRRKAINTIFWSSSDGFFVDYNLKTKTLSPELTLAGMAPFFLHVAGKEKIDQAKDVIEKKFLKAGGLLTTLKSTGQQWDAPNGWAPLEWMAISGLQNYGQIELAKEAATRWVKLNIKVFENTGKLMEKYNVLDTQLEAGGGEYPSQDGFGWTNGVLLGLMKKYDIKQ